jgi:hypothetical protein
MLTLELRGAMNARKKRNKGMETARVSNEKQEFIFYIEEFS